MTAEAKALFTARFSNGYKFKAETIHDVLEHMAREVPAQDERRIWLYYRERGVPERLVGQIDLHGLA